MFGVPVLFLSTAARDYFGGMIARGEARIIEVSNVGGEISGLHARKTGKLAPAPPDDLNVSLVRLRTIAVEYAGLCRTQG